MPILSVFFGMIVRMWHDDHPPPHVHVEYQGFVAQVSIETGEVMRGQLPKKSGGDCQRVVLEAPGRTV
jgi:hypothetical protein